MEPLIFSVVASLSMLLAVRFGNMSDRKKIEKIFDNTGITLKERNGAVKTCKFIRKNTLENGMEYVYRLPLGMPYAKLATLNDEIGVFKDGLHKNVEIEFDGGMVHVLVYETDLPKNWKYGGDV